MTAQYDKPLDPPMEFATAVVIKLLMYQMPLCLSVDLSKSMHVVASSYTSKIRILERPSFLPTCPSLPHFLKRPDMLSVMDNMHTILGEEMHLIDDYDHDLKGARPVQFRLSSLRPVAAVSPDTSSPSTNCSSKHGQHCT